VELAAAPAEAAFDNLAGAASVGRVRLAVPDARSTQVPNPEARFRDAPDRLPAPFLLVEGNDEQAVHAAAERLGRALGAPRSPRIFTLLLAQEAKAERTRS
jgi:hypothetical protein